MNIQNIPEGLACATYTELAKNFSFKCPHLQTFKPPVFTFAWCSKYQSEEYDTEEEISITKQTIPHNTAVWGDTWFSFDDGKKYQIKGQPYVKHITTTSKHFIFWKCNNCKKENE